MTDHAKVLRNSCWKPNHDGKPHCSLCEAMLAGAADIEEVERLRAIASDWEGVALDRDKECFRLRAIVTKAEAMRAVIRCVETACKCGMKFNDWQACGNCETCDAARRFDEAVGEE